MTSSDVNGFAMYTGPESVTHSEQKMGTIVKLYNTTFVEKTSRNFFYYLEKSTSLEQIRLLYIVRTLKLLGV